MHRPSGAACTASAASTQGAPLARRRLLWADPALLALRPPPRAAQTTLRAQNLIMATRLIILVLKASQLELVTYSMIRENNVFACYPRIYIYINYPRRFDIYSTYTVFTLDDIVRIKSISIASPRMPFTLDMGEMQGPRERLNGPGATRMAEGRHGCRAPRRVSRRRPRARPLHKSSDHYVALQLTTK